MKKTKLFAKRALSLLIMLVMMVSVMSAGITGISAATVDTAKLSVDEKGDVRTIYFSPNGYWNNLFAVYAWADNKDNGEWKALSKVAGVDGLYSVELSTAYTKAIFCSRVIPAFTWDCVDAKTDELVLFEEYNYLSLVGETTAMWGYYGNDDGANTPTETQKIYFTPNEEWTSIQSSLYHSFVVRAWNDANADNVWVEFELVEGTLGTYPCVWEAEIPVSYDNVQFCRAEGSVEDGLYVWETTTEQTVPADSNRFTQDDDVVTGTWSYYVAPEVNPDYPNPDEPDEPNPDTPVVPGVTKTIYFTPNAEWIAYTTDSIGRISAASWSGDGTKIWVWAESMGDGVYTVLIPEEATNIIFGVSFGATADVAWAQTDEQTIPSVGNHFTQDSEDTATGTWSVYKDSVSGVYYSVAFVNWDNTLLSAQAVLKGSSATAPENPTRANDSQYSYTFKGWDKSFDNVTSDIIVKAEYDKTLLPASSPATTGTLRVEVAGGTGFSISVDSGSARPQGPSYTNTKMPIGSTVTVTAKASSDATFLGWMNPANGQVLSKDLNYTFVTGGNDFIKASFVNDIEGAKLVLFKNDKAFGGLGHLIDMQYYSSEDAIVFPENPTQVGFDFAGWNMTEAEIKDAIASGEDVTVLATWTKQIVYVNLTVNGGTGGGQVIANFETTVT
ncbi:MAG: InlB B-repeat-containing protein, partial [Ruminococcus sp.]|nr:InlB B-repeat-containing protein [Ruminococcus sp.]